MLSESTVYRDSLIDGDRHIVRLTYVPTGATVECETKLPRDRKNEADVRKANRDKAWEMLALKVARNV